MIIRQDDVHFQYSWQKDDFAAFRRTFVKLC